MSSHIDSRAAATGTRLPDVAAWVQASHPWPLAVVVSLTVLIGLASADGPIAIRNLLLLTLAMLYNQLVVGWSNDYLDRETDHVFQPDKPLAAGRLKPGVLAAGIAVAALASIACGLLLGPVPLAWLLVGTAAGLSYNLGLKRTRLSPLPYVVAFAVLPIFAWSALGIFRGDLLWLYAIAWPLAGVAHVANSLPDIDADRRAGSSGLAATLGRRHSLGLVAGGIALTLLLLAASLPFLPYDPSILSASLAAFSLAVVAAAAFYIAKRDKAGFRAVSLACLIFVAGCLWAL